MARMAALAIAAILCSVCAAWAMALWSPLRFSRTLRPEESRVIIERPLGAVTFHGLPSGLRQWGFGCTLELASSVPVRYPPLELPTAVPPPANVAFQKVPGGPEDLSVQRLTAGWPLACMEGWTTMMGSDRRKRWLVNPPALGARPARAIPLCPRAIGLAANSAILAAAFWCVVPGPRLLRRRLRRARGRCADCGYDLAHLEQPVCPECGGRESRK